MELKKNRYYTRLPLNYRLFAEGILLERKQLIFNLLSYPKQKKKAYAFLICDPAGIRTQDPILKRDVLYQLSY